MKIQGIGLTADRSTPVGQAIPLQMTGAGTGKAIVPLTFKLSDASPTTTTNLTLTGESSRNAKNRRRVMIKVSLDYKALSTDATRTSIVDERRSGGELSCHLVLAGPKAFEDDLRGVNGANSRAAAESQLAIALRTLVSALGTGYTQPTHEWTQQQEGVFNYDPILREGVPLSVPGAAFDPGFEVDQYGVPAGPVICPNGEYGTNGFSCDVNTDNQSTKRPINDLGDPIVRGLSGLTPFTATSVINWNGFRIRKTV